MFIGVSMHFTLMQIDETKSSLLLLLEVIECSIIIFLYLFILNITFMISIE